MLKPLKAPGKTTIIVGLLAGAAGLLTGMGPDHAESFIKLFSEAAQSQFAQAGFMFTAAAWVHSGRVKKEIRSNFESLTTAISSVADAFRVDLKHHSERLDNLANRVESLENNRS